jgi:hypothetical protein
VDGVGTRLVISIAEHNGDGTAGAANSQLGHARGAHLISAVTSSADGNPPKSFAQIEDVATGRRFADHTERTSDDSTE